MQTSKYTNEGKEKFMGRSKMNCSHDLPNSTRNYESIPSQTFPSQEQQVCNLLVNTQGNRFQRELHRLSSQWKMDMMPTNLGENLSFFFITWLHLLQGTEKKWIIKNEHDHLQHEKKTIIIIIIELQMNWTSLKMLTSFNGNRKSTDTTRRSNSHSMKGSLGQQNTGSIFSFTFQEGEVCRRCIPREWDNIGRNILMWMKKNG